MENPELTLVVPVYNEDANILGVLRGLEGSTSAAKEILVVYDSDEDTTVPVVRAHLDEFPAVRLEKNNLGPGVLNALRSGFAAARGTWIIVTMADGSDDPREIESMLASARNGADLVAASRYMPGGRQVGGPWIKSLLSRAAGWSLSVLGRLPIHDPTSNFKLYSKRFLDSAKVESTAGFELALELSVKAAAGGWKMSEVPTTWRDRTAGQSRFKLWSWLPHYLRWYGFFFRSRLSRR
jgi:dolichol-phosphate mannosyltransferase